MACPLRIIATLAAMLGLTAYLGPLTAAAGCYERAAEAASKLRPSQRVALWLCWAAVLGFFVADILLSLGYTKCAFQYIAGLRRLLAAASAARDWTVARRPRLDSSWRAFDPLCHQVPQPQSSLTARVVM